MSKLGLTRRERKEIVSALVTPRLTAKKDRTIQGQYERIQPGPDGRSRTVLSPVVTETGRFSSSQSFLDPASTNWQNLVKAEAFADDLYRIRDCVIAPEGYKFLSCDLEKAEAVMVAAESGDDLFLEMLLGGEDIHDWHAKQFFGPDFTKLQRHLGKMTTYASFYMATVGTITRQLNQKADEMGFRVTEEEVRFIHDQLLDLHPLEEWWDLVWKELMDPSLYGGRRWLENALGFRRRFYNPNDYDLHKEAVNFPAQSGVASVLDRAMIRFDEEVEVPGECVFILQVHDELNFYVREGMVEEYAHQIKTLMEQPFEVRGREVYIPVEVMVGDRWDEWRGEEEDPGNPMGRLEVLDL